MFKTQDYYSQHIGRTPVIKSCGGCLGYITAYRDNVKKMPADVKSGVQAALNQLLTIRKNYF